MYLIRSMEKSEQRRQTLEATLMLWLVAENYNYNSSCQGYHGLLVNIPKQVLALKCRSRGSASECLHERKGDSERILTIKVTVTKSVCVTQSSSKLSPDPTM